MAWSGRNERTGCMAARVPAGALLMNASNRRATDHARANADLRRGSSEQRWFVPELQLRPVANQRGHVRNAQNGAKQGNTQRHGTITVVLRLVSC